MLSFVSNLGTYSANVGSASNAFPIANYSKISNTTCYDMSDLHSYDIKYLDDFIRYNYNLYGYTLKLVQTKVNNVGRQFRALYSNSKLKQMEFFVEKLYTLYNVLKSNTLNDGYELWDSNSQNSDYQKLVNYLSTSGLGGSKIPMTTENTTKTIRGFYNDGKSTYKVVINKNNNTVNLSIFENQTYLVVPEGFKVDKLLVPGTIKPEDQDAINVLTAIAQSNYT